MARVKHTMLRHYFLRIASVWIGLSFAAAALAQPGPLPFKADLTVAPDGSGNFTTIQAAVASIPHDNRERKIIFVKDGTSHEKVRVEANYVMLRGQSRAALTPVGAQSCCAHPRGATSSRRYICLLHA